MLNNLDYSVIEITDQNRHNRFRSVTSVCSVSYVCILKNIIVYSVIGQLLTVADRYSRATSDYRSQRTFSSPFLSYQVRYFLPFYSFSMTSPNSSLSSSILNSSRRGVTDNPPASTSSLYSDYLNNEINKLLIKNHLPFTSILSSWSDG